MTTQLDFAMGVAKELTYGTAATPTRFPEAECKLKYDITKVQGKGLRPTKNVDRLNRNSVVKFEGSGSIDVDVTTRGFGFLLNAFFGAVTNTLVPTTTPALYQQVHTLSKTDPHPTYTVQEILPVFDGTVGGQPHTFTGCSFDTFDLSAKEGAVVEASFGITARALSTAVAAATPVYPSDDSLFTFVHGAIIIGGGALTEPSTTAIASMTGLASTNIADFSLSVKRNLDGGGWNLGGAGLRSRAALLGKGDIAGKITAEYTDNTLRDAYLAQTPLAIVLTFTHDVAVSGTHKPTLQVVIPSIRLDGEIPTSDGGAPIKQAIDFKGFDNGIAAQSIYVVYRTLDSTV